MKLNTAGRRTAVGFALVALQFACMLLLAVTALPDISSGSVPPAALTMALGAFAMAIWILMHNRLGNFNIQPAPKKQGVLVTSGPYRWIRHPMYTTVMLGATALALMTEPVLGWSTWALLASVLCVKAWFEEQWMQEQHPGYLAYMGSSKRFIPFIL